MQLQLSTWQEVETYLRQSTAIILPIGSTEQHGPNGFIGTDALCPEVLAKAVGDEPARWSPRRSQWVWRSITWVFPAPSRSGPRH
jgi:creatinine amidohydrolase/Fe(II)-dependent formamide hydrolase-like protein